MTMIRSLFRRQRQRKRKSIITLIAIIFGIATLILSLLPFYFVGVIQPNNDNDNDENNDENKNKNKNKSTSTNGIIISVVNENNKVRHAYTTAVGADVVANTPTKTKTKTMTTNTNTNTNTINGTANQIQIQIQIPYIKYDKLFGEQPPNNDLFKLIKSRMDDAIIIASDANANKDTEVVDSLQHTNNNTNNNTNNTIGQYLLDFAIIGFPKCGTTTMMKWLNKHNNLGVVPFEIMSLQKHHPARILKYIMKEIPEGSSRRGFKSPNDIEDGRARNKLRIHYPSTKLIVGVRHPILWYESFYNHRIQNGYIMPKLAFNETSTSSSILDGYKNTCAGNLNGVCFTRARFHYSLVKWSKTSLLLTNGNNMNMNKNNKEDEEWNYFTKKEQKSLRNNEIKTAIISPNPIFIYDVNQLRMPTSDTSSTDNTDNTDTDEQQQQQQQQQQYYNEFVLSLQGFLNITKDITNMPLMMNESPGKQVTVGTVDIDNRGFSGTMNISEQIRRNTLKMNICDKEFDVIRSWLLESGQQIYEWITNYFINSNNNNGGVFVGGNSGNGSSEQFIKHLKLYGIDPCPKRERERERIRLQQKQ